MELTGTYVVQVPPLLNPQSLAQLRADIQAALASSSTDVVLLKGTGDVFCRGLDLGEAAEIDDARGSVELFSGLLQAIRCGNKPVIALVNGTAVAGGVGLAVSCDGVLATPNATFALTELLFGLLPAMIFPFLAQRLTVQKVRWLALTARTVSAQEALALGIADEVCQSEMADKVLRSWIRQLRRLNPAAAAIWKQMTANPAAVSPAYAIEATLQQLNDPTVRAGLSEFIASGSLPFLRRQS